MNVIHSIFFIIISACLTQFFFFYAKKSRLIDFPNGRNLHKIPTVRGGGVVFIGVTLVFWIFMYGQYFNRNTYEQFVFLASIIIIALVGFLDDLFKLSIVNRLIFQCLIALLIVLFIRPQQVDFALFRLTNVGLIAVFLFISTIWAINHFNFMDGMDGYCTMQSIFLLSVYAFFFSIQGSIIYQDFCIIIVSCLLGFLIFNYPPAKLFMGDVGSASLGLITFFLIVIAQKQYQVPIINWFILNALFLFDSIVTLLRRFFNNEQWFMPHKKHAYQRLKLSGVHSKFILIGQAFLNIFFFILVLFFENNILNIIQVLLIQLSLLLAIYLYIEKKIPMY